MKSSYQSEVECGVNTRIGGHATIIVTMTLWKAWGAHAESWSYTIYRWCIQTTWSSHCRYITDVAGWYNMYKKISGPANARYGPSLMVVGRCYQYVAQWTAGALPATGVHVRVPHVRNPRLTYVHCVASGLVPTVPSRLFRKAVHSSH